MSRRDPQTPEEWRSQAEWARRKAEKTLDPRYRRKFLAIAEMAEVTALALERADT